GGVAARDKAREWARAIRATLAELGLERERLAVDKLDAVGFLALQEEGITIVDVGPAIVDAREVKTPEEVALFALNGAIGVATPEQKEAYRVAYDCVRGMLELVRPGISFEDFARKAPRLPAAYAPQRYPTMVHQAGLEDEGPGIPYPDDDRGPRRIMPKREL